MLSIVRLSNKPGRGSVWKRYVQKGLLTLVLLAFTSLIVIPFLWMIQMSLKTNAEVLADPYALPSRIQWRNYVDLLTSPAIRFYRYFYNSAFVTFCSLVISTTLGCLGGYGFARRRYDFKLRRVLFSLLVMAMILPGQIKFIPQFTMMAQYGLINTRWALVLLYTAGALPFTAFIMTSYFSQLPVELEDAARMDGCGEIRIFWQVMLPLARPAVVTTLVLNFRSFWNELLLSITMVTDPAMRTLPSAIYNFIGDVGSNYAMAASSLVLSMLPVLILYVLLSDRFVEGMTAGAVKA